MDRILAKAGLTFFGQAPASANPSDDDTMASLARRIGSNLFKVHRGGLECFSRCNAAAGARMAGIALAKGDFSGTYEGADRCNGAIMACCASPVGICPVARLAHEALSDLEQFARLNRLLRMRQARQIA